MFFTDKAGTVRAVVVNDVSVRHLENSTVSIAFSYWHTAVIVIEREWQSFWIIYERLSIFPDPFSFFRYVCQSNPVFGG